MGWYYGSIPIFMYGESGGALLGNFLILADAEPLLLTDLTPMELAG